MSTCSTGRRAAGAAVRTPGGRVPGSAPMGRSKKSEKNSSKRLPRRRRKSPNGSLAAITRTYPGVLRAYQLDALVIRVRRAQGDAAPTVSAGELPARRGVDRDRVVARECVGGRRGSAQRSALVLQGQVGEAGRGGPLDVSHRPVPL